MMLRCGLVATLACALFGISACKPKWPARPPAAPPTSETPATTGGTTEQPAAQPSGSTGMTSAPTPPDSSADFKAPPPPGEGPLSTAPAPAAVVVPTRELPTDNLTGAPPIRGALPPGNTVVHQFRTGERIPPAVLQNMLNAPNNQVSPQLKEMLRRNPVMPAADELLRMNMPAKTNPVKHGPPPSQ